MRSRLRVLAIALLVTALTASLTLLSSAGTNGWPTYHGDPARTGVEPSRPLVSAPPSVAWASAALDGPIYAEPLIVGGRVFIATENDTIYAFDEATGALAPGWTAPVHIGQPVPASSLGGPICSFIDPVGITSTPVIDPVAGILYAVGLVQAPIHYVLVAVNVGDGSIRFVRDIAPPDLDPVHQMQRPALALSQGRVYIGFGSRNDCRPFHGWVVSASASDATAALEAYEVGLNGVPAEGGSVWAPSGIAVDSAGFLYVTTGNAGALTYDGGDSVIRFATDPLRRDSYFAPSNWSALATYDLDLGSVAPAILNDGLLFAIGKEGVGYLLRANALPGIGNELFSARVCGDGAYGGTAYAPPYLFVSCTSSGVARLTVSTVTPQFTVDWYSGPSASDPAVGPPIVVAGAVWSVASGEGLLHALSIATGADLFPPISLSAYGTPVHFSGLASANGRLFVPAGRRLVAFGFPPLATTTISGVTTGVMTNVSAQVTWATNNPADSRVAYGTTAAYGSSTALDAALLTSHAQTLTGLTPNTTYHYQVTSHDAAGTLVASADGAFTTPSAPPSFSLALGGTGYASVGLAQRLNTTGDWTVESWFKDESAGGYNHDAAYLLMKGNTDLLGESPFVLGVQYNSLFAGVRAGWSNQYVNASLLATTANAWHHVAATFVASTRQVTIYIDGAQRAQGVVGAVSTGNSGPLEIGRNGNGAGAWHGKVDDVRIWNIARTGAEIQTSFNTELAIAPASLVGNWRFDEGIGTAANDSSASQENAAIVGGAWSADVGNSPPAPPPPTTIGVVAATNITNGSAQITWTTNNPASGQVRYGTTAAYGGTTVLDAALVTSHSQQITGLAANTLYHYQVVSADGGGTLLASGDFTFTTAAAPPPTTITAVAASRVTNSGAQIDWTTNNPSYSQVEYGTTATYGSTTTLDAALVTGHTVALTGLTANTLYHYRARSADAGGTLVLSADATFTTPSAPAASSLLLNGAGYAEAPNDPELNTTGDWTLEAWFKDEAAGGYNHDFTYIVMKGNTDVDGESPYVLGVQYSNLFAGERTAWTNQTLSASVLATSANAWHHAAATFASSSRQLTIYLDGTLAAQGILPSRTTTGNDRPLEIGRNGNGVAAWRGKLDDIRLWNVVRTATEIQSSFRTELASAPLGLVANWKFDEGAGAVAGDGTTIQENATLLSGALWSADVGNGPSAPPPPTAISAVTASNVTNGSAQISWTTNNPADSQVEYGTTTAYGAMTTPDTARVLSHSQQVGGLAASTLYHYRVRSTDAGGTLALSADASFTTAAPPPPTTISGVSAGNLSNTGATATWTTNNPATSQVEYGPTAAYGTTTALDPALVTSHTQTLTGLAANTLYHYRARGTDAGGALALSADGTFTTTNAPAANSLLLNAAGYAEVASAAKLNLTGDWSLEAWFKDESLFTGYNHDTTYLVMKGNTDGNGEATYLLGIAWNTVFAGERTAWVNYAVSAPTSGLAPATWHHVTATMASATRTMTLYLDGTQVTQGVLGARSTIGNALPVEIGRNGNGSGAFRGKIDDVRIWNVVRTGTEISANYASELATFPAALVGNWRFDEGIGTSAADATAGPQNATLLGGASWSADIGNGPPPPPPPTVISGVTTSNITTGGARIGWTTNNPASSQVRYGTTTAYGGTTTLDGALLTSHSQQLSGLAASTIYHYQVVGADAGGTPVVSGDFTFTTTAAPPPTTISAVASGTVTNTGAQISWTTNNPASSQVEYGTTATYGTATTLDATMTTSHGVALAGLASNTLYHYRVRGTDAGGTLVLSTDATFTTTNAAAATSLLLNGAGYVEAPHDPELNLTGDWTLEAWFKDESTFGFNHDVTYILLKGNTDTSGEAPLMLGIAWNTLFAGERTGWTNYSVSASLIATDPTRWHHAAATFVAATRTLTLFLDGTQVASGTLGARTTTGNALPIEIGRNGNGAGGWRGKLDDVRIWNVARTATQISGSYSAEFTAAQTNLVANWRFDAGAGATDADLTMPAENATLFAGATWSADVHPMP